MAEYDKPLPLVKRDIKDFWDACKRHELVIQRCKDCGTFRHTPRPMCHNCSSMNTENVVVSGKGTVYSYTIVTHPVHPGFMEVPYAVVLVELPDAGGVRMVSNIVDCPPEEVRIGMPVEVCFDDVTEEITLPRFKRA